MPQPQTLSAERPGGVRPAKSSIRFRSADVRRPTVGIVAHVTLASCTCPDQTWRDRLGKIHFCKHIVWVYANRQKALRRGRTRFTVKSLDPQRAAAGAKYTVTVFTCHRPDGERCPDWRPGVVELCEHLREVYEMAGFPAPRPVEPIFKGDGGEAYWFRGIARAETFILVAPDGELFAAPGFRGATAFVEKRDDPEIVTAAEWIHRWPPENQLFTLFREAMDLTAE